MREAVRSEFVTLRDLLGQLGPRLGERRRREECARDPMAFDQLESAVDSVLARLVRAGPTPTELDDLRAKVRRGAALSYEGASRTGFRLGYLSVLRSPEYEDELFRSLLHVTAPQARDRAQALFRRESRVVVRYTPTGGAEAE